MIRVDDRPPKAVEADPPRLDAFRALSYRFAVETDLREVAHLLADLLGDLRVPPGPGEHVYELRREPHERPFAAYVDGELIHRVRTPLALVDEVLWHANRTALLRPDPRIAIHASAATWLDRGLLFPGPANSGKTTLVAGLLCRGATYVTDEAALIDPGSGLVDPYPKPMWMAPKAIRAVAGLQDRLRPEYRELSRVRAYLTPSDVGAGVASAPTRVDFLIAPTFRFGAETSLEPMSRAEGLITLARNAFGLTPFGRDGILALAELVRGAGCYRLMIGDHDAALGLVNALVHGRWDVVV
jgi:hypothetical protein